MQLGAVAFPWATRADLRLVFADDFAASTLDRTKWCPFYLPHWGGLERTRPRYTVADGRLVLRIDPDQEPWCPQWDGTVTVSSIQTGHRSGPLGSCEGQLRFREGLVVREEVPEARLYTPLHGAFVMRARADISDDNMVALWMIGVEDHPDDAGEITIMEVFGDAREAGGTRLGHGIKALNDPRLATDFESPLLPFDVADWHVYGAEWTPEGVSFFLDGERVRHVRQSPVYPMQIMLNIYRFPDRRAATRETPATLTIDWVRGYEHLRG